MDLGKEQEEAWREFLGQLRTREVATIERACRGELRRRAGHARALAWHVALWAAIALAAAIGAVLANLMNL